MIVEQWPDNTVIVSESFDAATEAKLSSAIRTTSPDRHAEYMPQEELSMRLYDLPAFREWQARIGEEILRRSGAECRTRECESHMLNTDAGIATSGAGTSPLCQEHK